ncbi:MAG: hypothetical protein ACOYKA_06710 [Legionellaceae bacterium]
MNESTDEPEKLAFLSRKLRIQRAIYESAFRRGTSLFRFGLIPSNVSDHLPIDIHLRLNQEDHNLLSWNMLSEAHLFNNFMSVTGLTTIHKLMDQLLREQGGTNIYQAKGMSYHLFAELSQFLYHKLYPEEGVSPVRGPEPPKKIKIDEHLLEEFCHLSTQGTRILGRHGSEEDIKQVELARHAFLRLYTSEDPSIAHDIRQSMLHALDMIYHIKHQEGALTWANRLKSLRQNKALLAHLLDKELLMFQEVTDTADLFALFKGSDGSSSMQLIEHPGAPSQDNCVILFDKDRYALVGEPVKGDVHRKPYIFAVLKDKLNGKLLISASIHHPGGEVDYRQTYLDVVDELRKKHQDVHLPYVIAGDYNHTASQFGQINPRARMKMLYPMTGSMAGNDYGNVNQGIDGVCTDLSPDDVYVKTVDDVSTSVPAGPIPYVVQFYSQGQPEPYAGNLSQAVLNEPCERDTSELLLEVNSAARSGRVRLAM